MLAWFSRVLKGFEVLSVDLLICNHPDYSSGTVVYV